MINFFVTIEKQENTSFCDFVLNGICVSRRPTGLIGGPAMEASMSQS